MENKKQVAVIDERGNIISIMSADRALSMVNKKKAEIVVVKITIGEKQNGN